MRLLPVPDGASCVRVLSVQSAVFLIVAAASAARACIVGNPAAPASLVITETPPDCCYGDWAGSLHGTVSNVDTHDAVVFVYAQTDLFYVQPVVGASVEIGCSGAFSTAVRGGARYSAILAHRSWQAPATLASLPPVGGDILAVVSAPDAQRRIEFAGSSWIVKSTGTVPYGPGPNLWSDAPDAVWVDALGRLHLRITQRDGVWYSAEVFSESYVGHGRYRFDVEGALDTLDPNVVFAGFFYSDQGDEADIEFSRWGDPGRATNAQFVVQPDAIHAWSVPATTQQTLQFDWSAQSIDFSAWSEATNGLREPIATWSHTGAVPTPDVERMRFNLWLYGGSPTDGNEVEVIVSSYTYDAPTDVITWVPDVVRVQAHPLSPTHIAYTIDLPEAGTSEVRVFDPRGRLVERLMPQHRPSGRSHGVWRPRVDLARGVYFMQARSGVQSGATRFVVLR